MGGSNTNPTVNNYLYNVRSIVPGQPLLSTKSNAGAHGHDAAPYKYTTSGPLRAHVSKPKRLQYESIELASGTE